MQNQTKHYTPVKYDIIKNEIDGKLVSMIKDESTSLFVDTYNRNNFIVKTSKRFISEIFNFIKSGTIIDKSLPGVGFTSYMATNNFDVILVAPTRIFLEKYRNDNKYLVFDSNKHKTDDDYYNAFSSYYDFCVENDLKLKVIVTMDCLFRLDKIIYNEESIIEMFTYIFIDEIHSILDSFKLRVVNFEKSFNTIDKYWQKTILVTATMPKELPTEFFSKFRKMKIEFSHNIQYNIHLSSDFLDNVTSLTNKNNETKLTINSNEHNLKFLTSILKKLSYEKVLNFNNNEFLSVSVFLNGINLPIKLIKEIGLLNRDVTFICGSGSYKKVKEQGFKLFNETLKLTRFNFITESGYNAIEWNDDKNLNIIYTKNESSNIYELLSSSEIIQSLNRNRAFIKTKQINAIIMNTKLLTKDIVNDINVDYALAQNDVEFSNKQTEKFKELLKLRKFTYRTVNNIDGELKYEIKLNVNHYYAELNKAYDIESMYNIDVTREEYFKMLNVPIKYIEFILEESSDSSDSPEIVNTFNEYVSFAKENIKKFSDGHFEIEWDHRFVNKLYIRDIESYFNKFGKIPTNATRMRERLIKN